MPSLNKIEFKFELFKNNEKKDKYPKNEMHAQNLF